jgi:hypothetical protein
MKINRLFAIALACIGASTITSCSDQVLFPSNQHLQLVKVSGQNSNSIRPLKPAVIPSLPTSFIAKKTSASALKQMSIPALQIAKSIQTTANANNKITYSKSDIKIIPSELKTVIKKSNQLKKQLEPNDGDPALRGIGWVFIILGIIIFWIASILVGLLMMLVGLLFVNSGKPR